MTFKKQILLPILMIFATLFLVACGGDASPTPEDEMIELTLEELAVFDGTNGKKAYIAVDGFIYDVTNSSDWRNGNHNGYKAGQDLSQAILSSPHGKSFLSRVPKIGILVEKTLPTMLTAISSVQGYESLVSIIYSGQLDIDFESFDAITIFLPSLEAFALNAMLDVPSDFDPSDGFGELLGNIDLFDVLRYHMVEQSLLLEALKTGSSDILTLNGETLSITVVDNQVYVNDIPIKTSDILATNGVIHVLDGVLVPPSIEFSVTVTYLGLNNVVVTKQTYTLGETLVFPTAPTIGGYTFKGFSTSALTLTEDITVTLNYEKIYMTLSELSQYDGRNGNQAFIAYQGVIYNVTGNLNWPNGNHRGYQAGQDMTSIFASVAPHSASNITNLEVVAFLATNN